MTNNNSAVNNNNTAANSMKTYKVNIASNEKGHDTLEFTLEAATDSIIENAESNARWVFINGAKFEFEGTNFRSEANVQKLQAHLQEVEDPLIMLTGQLVGGVNL